MRWHNEKPMKWEGELYKNLYQAPNKWSMENFILNYGCKTG